MKTVYFGLGSNVGDRERTLQLAIDRLHASGMTVKRLSPVYETEPVDYHDQRWFLNLVAEVETELLPLQLLARVQKIEIELGRKRILAKGPRVIDIDILFYGSFVIETGRLVVPHPAAHERRFVLAPMVDLAPEMKHPALRRTMRDLLGSVMGQSARKVETAIRAPGAQ